MQGASLPHGATHPTGSGELPRYLNATTIISILNATFVDERNEEE